MTSRLPPARCLVRVACALAIVFAAGRDARAQDCDANHHITWPAGNPVWDLCWTSPANSAGIDGSGLEISSVRYNGRLVLTRGHMPVINVKYDPGGCGGPDLSFRDQGNLLVRFEANNVIRPDYAEPTVPPRTVCDTPGMDVGTFTGVAAEKLADRLILTTQIEAGWYRYILSWTFLPDGTFEPGIRFTAVQNVCTPLAHYHDVYWRLDFDVDGADNDAIDERNGSLWTALTTEARRLNSPATGRQWRVRDKVTGSAYELVPNANADIADAWSIGDLWALHFRDNELDDGGATGGLTGDQPHIDRYLNGERINAQDVVVWYRAGFRHVGAADCELGGPTIRPARTPSVSLSANGQQGPITVGPGDPLRIDIGFDAAAAGVVNPAEVYVGLATAGTVLFLNPILGFVPFPSPVYAGPLASFPPAPLINLPSAGALAPGSYLWFIVVDADSDSVIDGDFFDWVITIITP